uniref:Uncharacterized protein n=1 Tax=Sphaerodactylus townsendi TaxID=933632 RepID=A0ACB8FYT8_9SAUR
MPWTPLWLRVRPSGGRVPHSLDGQAPPIPTPGTCLRLMTSLCVFDGWPLKPIVARAGAGLERVGRGAGALLPCGAGRARAEPPTEVSRRSERAGQPERTASGEKRCTGAPEEPKTLAWASGVCCQPPGRLFKGQFGATKAALSTPGREPRLASPPPPSPFRRTWRAPPGTAASLERPAELPRVLLGGRPLLGRCVPRRRRWSRANQDGRRGSRGGLCGSCSGGEAAGEPTRAPVRSSDPASVLLEPQGRNSESWACLRCPAE